MIRTVLTFAVIGFVSLAQALPAVAQSTWKGPTPPDGSAGGDWNTATNWTAGVPNAPGAAANFTSTTTTANRAYTFSANVTIGSLTINTNSAGTNIFSVVDQVTPSLTFDSGVLGMPATVTVTGTNGITNATSNIIRGAVQLNSDLVVDVTRGTTGSSAGEFSLQRGVVSGPGGIRKEGTGYLTYADAGDKSYTGATIINGGRLRINGATKITGTSGITVASGAQFVLDGAADWTFGPSANTVVTLNGMGLPAGHAIGNFPGAIRTGSGQTSFIRNKIHLATDAAINVVSNGTAGPFGILHLVNEVSGPGKFIANPKPGLISREGSIMMLASNSYEGGTLIEQGSLIVSSLITSGAKLGSGDVYIDGASPAADFNPDGAASGKLVIESGISNAISDDALVTITGGGTTGLADRGYINLGAGVNDLIGGLVLGGTPYTAPGTYGAPGSAADFQPAEFAEYFTGTGVLRLEGVAGDFNDDGVVDILDYVHIRQNAATPTEFEAQYADWSANYGEGGPGSGANSAVPEPASFLLATVAACLMLHARGHRKR